MNSDTYDVFKNKKILIVCAETQAWPMHYVAAELKPHCESISAIFIQPGEAYFKAQDYLQFKKLNKDMYIYEMSNVVAEYLDKEKCANFHVDRGYIDYIEKNYTTYSILNEQFLSEMTILPYYHDRNYYKFVDYDRILLYAQLYYKAIEQIFLTNKPDVILDCDVDFFGRTVLLEVATKFGIPYISIDHARVNGYVTPTDALSKRIQPHVRQYFRACVADASIMYDEELLRFYDEVQEKIGAIPKRFEKEFEKLKFNAYLLLKELVIHNVIFFSNISLKRLFLNKVRGITSPICGDSFGKLKFIYLYYIRRFYLHYFKVFSRTDLKGQKFIYVPLHVIPESSTTILSPIYINEQFIIESLSKSVAADQFIVVKEHWSMIGFRPLSFYEKMKRLPNVILIDPELNNPPKYYIENSDLIVTISGSSALEGAMLGKNSLVFSDVIFSVLSGVKKINIDQSLKTTIQSQMRHYMDKREKLAYLKMIKEFGAPVEMKSLYYSPDRVKRTDVYANVASLINIYRKGLVKFSSH